MSTTPGRTPEEPPADPEETSGDASGEAPAASSTTSGSGSGSKPAGNPAALVFDDPLDRPSADDTDRGWGERSGGSGDDDFTRFLNEKPPHHL